VDILWFAIAPLRTATEGKGRKDPETLGCVRFRDGLDLLSRFELVNVIGKKSTEAHIAKYCSEMDLTPLWEVQPDIVGVPQGGRTNLGNRSSENESVLTERLVAIENKMSKRESSLQDMLAKLENRMASMEKKLSKVDEIERSTISITEVLDALCEKVGIR
jgi:hypothetical protein